MFRWCRRNDDTGKRDSAHSLRILASVGSPRLIVDLAGRDSDLGLGPDAPLLTVHVVAAIPDFVEAVAVEGHDVMIMALKPARQVFGLSGRIRPVLFGCCPT